MLKKEPTKEEVFQPLIDRRDVWIIPATISVIIFGAFATILKSPVLWCVAGMSFIGAIAGTSLIIARRYGSKRALIHIVLSLLLIGVATHITLVLFR